MSHRVPGSLQRGRRWDLRHGAQEGLRSGHRIGHKGQSSSQFIGRPQTFQIAFLPAVQHAAGLQALILSVGFKKLEN